MTRLRKMMLEELERRNFSQSTTRTYIRTVEDFACYFHQRPDQLCPEHVREYRVPTAIPTSHTSTSLCPHSALWVSCQPQTGRFVAAPFPFARLGQRPGHP